MIYRKLLSFTIALALALSLSACDLLDVDPAQSIDTETAFESAEAAEGALNGMYSGVQGSGVYGGFFTTMGDFTSNNANFSGSFTTWQNARDFNKLASHGPSQAMWSGHYTAINRANNIIEQVPELVEAGTDPEADEAFENRLVGQATFVRALMHFNLVRLYAEPYEPGASNTQDGVPLVTSRTESAEDDLDLPRSSVEDVYSQIVTDLETAQSLLSPSSNGIRATQGAATALLAKVRLYQGEYAEAASLAEDVINSGTYELDDPVSVADQGGGSSESIFAIRYLADDNTGVNSFPSSFYLPQDIGGRGDIRVTTDLLDLIEDDDLRGPEGIMYGYDDGGVGACEVGPDCSAWTNKWDSPQNADDAFVLRLSEMYLIAAEGLAREGQDDPARGYLNDVRAEANASDIESDVEGSDLLDAIIQERRVELAFEGDWRHDVLRRGAPLVSSTGVADDSQNTTQRIFPIPQRDRDVNPELTQNPGY